MMSIDNTNDGRADTTFRRNEESGFFNDLEPASTERSCGITQKSHDEFDERAQKLRRDKDLEALKEQVEAQERVRGFGYQRNKDGSIKLSSLLPPPTAASRARIAELEKRKLEERKLKEKELAREAQAWELQTLSELGLEGVGKLY